MLVVLSRMIKDDILQFQLSKLEGVEYIHQETIFRTQSVASWGLDRIDQRDLPLDDVFEPTGGETNTEIV